MSFLISNARFPFRTSKFQRRGSKVHWRSVTSLCKVHILKCCISPLCCMSAVAGGTSVLLLQVEMLAWPRHVNPTLQHQKVSSQFCNCRGLNTRSQVEGDSGLRISPACDGGFVTIGFCLCQAGFCIPTSVWE